MQLARSSLLLVAVRGIGRSDALVEWTKLRCSPLRGCLNSAPRSWPHRKGRSTRHCSRGIGAMLAAHGHASHPSHSPPQDPNLATLIVPALRTLPLDVRGRIVRWPLARPPVPRSARWDGWRRRGVRWRWSLQDRTPSEDGLLRGRRRQWCGRPLARRP